MKSIELEHVGKKRRRGKSGTDDVEVRTRVVNF